MKNKKFWVWKNQRNDESNAERLLEIYGTIAEDSWFDDDITPKMFHDELFSGSGDVTIWINSPGGDCIAASQIYSMLMDYKGNVTIKVDGIAASAASVIAMAGTKVLMAPTALMMIHNPATQVFGDHKEMTKGIEMLNEVKESIINAYEIKTGMSRSKISRLMDEETWMNANKAIELGFADDILKDGKKQADVKAYAFSTKQVATALLNKIVANQKDKKAIKTNYLSKIKKYLKEISADKIKVSFAYNKTWKPLLQAYYKSGSFIKLFIFFLLFCTIIISFIISLSKGNLTFVIIFSIFITFFVDFNNKVLIPFMSFYRNLTNVFELERDALKPKIDKIAEENLQSPKYLKYDYQWDSYDGIEWFLSSSIINEHLKNKASKMTLKMERKKATFPEEAKNYLALVISTKLKDNKKIFNNCLIGLNDDFDLDMTQVELKKTDYYSYVSIDEMIYKTIKSKQIISYELNGSMFSVSKSGYLYDMKNAICSNIIGINIIIRTKDDYLLISRQSDENDENQNKWVPSASGSLDYNDYTSGTKSFASLLFAGMFRELKEETGIDYRYNKKDILDIHLLGYVRLLKKGGKPDFFSQCKIDKTKDELKEILDKVRKKRTTEILEFSFINLKPLFNSDAPLKALIKDIYGLKISLQLYFTLLSIVKEEKRVVNTTYLKNDFKFPNIA